MADFYELLGVPRSASVAEVRKAYAALARERHPDRFSDPAEKRKAQEQLQDLTAAFNTLSNDRERRAYDESLEKPRATTPEEQAKEAFTEGQALLQAGSLEDAIARFRAAVHQAPTGVPYIIALAKALARSTQTAHEAVETYERAIRLQPQAVALYLELANLLLRLGLRLRAKKLAEAALRLAPKDPHVQSLAADLGVGDPEGGAPTGFLRRKQ
jgi:curved DNA-binding protein CbpA